jgi:preprotein translocase subunit SecG
MITVILVIHLILALALIGVVLLQKSEGGALGMGGGGMSGFMSGRSTANLLTRTTAILAGLFMATSIVLALLAGQQRAPHSIVDQPAATPGAPAAPQSAPASPPAAAPTPAPAAPAPAPAAPAEPSPPLAK